MTAVLRKIKKRSVSFILWSIGLGLFIPFGLFIIVYSLFFDPRRIDPFLKAGCRFILNAMLIRTEVSGLQHVDAEKTVVFMANHVNVFDALVLFGYIPNYARGVELDKHFKWPLWGLLLKRLGQIPISRDGGKKALQSLETARQRIENGTSIIILPEGTRTLTGEPGTFKRGPFILVKAAKTDIVPVVMIDAFQIKHKGSSIITPGTIKVKFGKPVRYSDIKHLHTRDILKVVEGKIRELFESDY
ncbi:MAG: lysophospholipid acyltransferase family protein [candidate division KSB1 bacterium]|nr:lysophospholipid acyltransferase family protein [candidate division KSB1 bacterium]